MQQNYFLAFTSYFGLALWPLQLNALSDTDTLWICVDCALERGFRWPLNGHVHEKLTVCDHCGKRGACFEKDDLIPATEDP